MRIDPDTGQVSAISTTIDRAFHLIRLEGCPIGTALPLSSAVGKFTTDSRFRRRGSRHEVARIQVREFRDRGI